MSYELTGRTIQKSRTRAALIQAARDLFQQGITPTVEQAAAAASVSRPTAYRYFPNQGLLIAAAHPEVATRSLLGQHPPSDPLARLDEVALAITDLVLTNEAALRAMLRLSLQRGPDSSEHLALRTGRRIEWIDDAIAQLKGRLTASVYGKLVLAIATLLGVESLIWLTDVAGLSREDAAEQMRWSAHELLRNLV